ncbi:hypothetical protein GCM10007876_28650 [Litoribrevibacter albus]|uniref:Thioesterase n=2 Tax=Litoribrevibacter albus TaxID=1473156 RepID=A0AA37SBN2_9GAMM|nr:hypothetical protein GCM10007876_28650 [Litoribrevibacter albus]
MTNTRYANLFDLSHIQIFSQLGLVATLKQLNWTPIINARTISYFKELSPFEVFTVTSKLICWDRSYFYLEHRILNQAGKTSAICYSRGLILNKNSENSKGIISIKQVIEEAFKAGKGPNLKSLDELTTPDIPEHIKHWTDTLKIQKKTAKSTL